jgi:O-acetylserine/cysteine efflux transporter
MKTSLTIADALLALAIVVIWGTNFVVARIAINVLPPLFLATLRFTFVLLPLVFILPRPRVKDAADQKVPWRNLAGYGFFIGMGQFGLLFIAMNGSISPGLASLVVQMQVFFTVALSMLRNREGLRPHQLAAFALALAGMAVIVAHNGNGATVGGVILTLGAAVSWALGNQIAKEGRATNFVAYVVWASLFSVPPLLTVSLLLEGWPAILHGAQQASPAIWAIVVWQAVGNTLFGYACWAWLLSRYPAATIAPLSLLVPVFGFAASALWLGEPLQGWKIAAAGLVMAGLALNLLWRGRGTNAMTPRT